MTILISDMGDTVIASFKRGTFKLADWTVLPKVGVWRDFCEAHPWLLRWMEKWKRREEEKKEGKRVAGGFPVGPQEEDSNATAPTLEEVAELDRLDNRALARKLAIAIRKTATDLTVQPPRMYTYEEWAEYTHLIRFSRMDPRELEEAEEEQGLVEWDWIGEDSPMMAEQTEPQWVLDRLCESLDRYMRIFAREGEGRRSMSRGSGGGGKEKEKDV